MHVTNVLFSDGHVKSSSIFTAGAPRMDLRRCDRDFTTEAPTKSGATMEFELRQASAVIFRALRDALRASLFKYRKVPRQGGERCCAKQLSALQGL